MHRLSDIDEEARTASCAECGPTKIRVKHQGHGRKSWTCVGVRNSQRHKNRTKRAEETGAWPERHKSDGTHKRELGDRCERCGFVPEHWAQMDIHHRDHDHSNDSHENLELICANCHRLEHAGRGRVKFTKFTSNPLLAKRS